MSKTDQIQCYKHLESFAVSESEINTARYEGKLEGRKEGREKGREENIREVILRAYNNNISIPTIATLTQLSEKKVKQVLTEKGLLERS